MLNAPFNLITVVCNKNKTESSKCNFRWDNLQQTTYNAHHPSTHTQKHKVRETPSRHAHTHTINRWQFRVVRFAPAGCHIYKVARQF